MYVWMDVSPVCNKVHNILPLAQLLLLCCEESIWKPKVFTTPRASNYSVDSRAFVVSSCKGPLPPTSTSYIASRVPNRPWESSQSPNSIMCTEVVGRNGDRAGAVDYRMGEKPREARSGMAPKLPYLPIRTQAITFFKGLGRRHAAPPTDARQTCRPECFRKITSGRIGRSRCLEAPLLSYMHKYLIYLCMFFTCM